MPFIRSFVFVASFSFFLAAANLAPAADDYVPGPDSNPQEGVPKGKVTKYSFDHSRIFPGTVRDYWIYIPRQYEPAKPACLYVGQDGLQFKAATVFDNLIEHHEMPVTIGVFIMHGRVKAETTNVLDRFNRSYEYDGLGDNYVRFVLGEILPEVEGKTAADGRVIHISKDANDHAIGGSSSGAICAFTAAWERPDAFRRVFSSVGTYVDQRGGNDYPALIRKTEAKPLRVFLQDGSNDLNGVGGSWFLANQEMASALEFSGYEVNHIWGDGGHNGKHATAVFPDAMRWLWKDWPKAVACGVDSKQAVAEVLIPGESWQAAQDGPPALVQKAGAAFCAGYNGNSYLADPAKKQIWLKNTHGRKTIVDSGMAFYTLCFSPDQSLLLADNPLDQFVYSFHIGADGSLTARQAYHHLRRPDAVMETGARGMAVDTHGILYVATDLGIQMCDQAGRLIGIISTPPGEFLSNIAFGGPDSDELFARSGGRILKRKLNTRGAFPFQPPLKPAAPNL